MAKTSILPRKARGVYSDGSEIKKDVFFDATGLTTASTNTIVDAADISGVSNGDEISLESGANELGGKLFRFPDQVKLTATDAAGTDLVVVATVYGRRFGRDVSEQETLNTGGSFTATTAQVFDQVTRVVVDTITNEAASDTLDVETAGTRLGLSLPIGEVADVKKCVLVDEVGATEAITHPDLDTDLVDVANSAIITDGDPILATTTTLREVRVEYTTSGEGIRRAGAYA